MLFLTTKKILGILYGTITGMSLLMNIIAVIAVFQLAFVQKKNQVYIIAFFNIISDIVQMFLGTFYLCPSIITDSYLVGNEKKTTATLLLGSTFLFFWYFETVTQMIMAINRCIVICLQKHRIFTFKSTLIIFIVLFPACFVTTYITQYYSPCCSFLFDQTVLSYSYYAIPGIPNYSNEFDLPLNATSSAISAFCYILIFWTVHNSAPIATTTISMVVSKRNRDIKYAIQFAMILVFYVITWVLFRLLPIVLINRNIEWFILVPTFFTMNCTSNAIIYLGFNSEVQSNVRIRVVREFLQVISNEKTSVVPTPTATISQPHSQPKLTAVPKIFHTQPFRAIQKHLSPHKHVNNLNA